MVKVGFVAEGECDVFVLGSQAFRDSAASLGIHVCRDVINAHGEGNLRHSNLIPFVNLCHNQPETPNKIIVLTDLDQELCVTEVKKRISASGMADGIVVARKALEAWFLADHEGLSAYLGRIFPFIEFPEQTPADPWKTLREQVNRLDGRGIGSNKKAFAKKFAPHFSLVRAAQHPQCPSAQYLLDTLKALSFV